MVEIKVLGPIRGFRNGKQLDLGGPTQRRLLAALVARPDETVAVTSLLEDLWGDDPPPSGPQSIQSYVSRLRRELGSNVIETLSPGYRLGSGQVSLDSAEFLMMAAELPDEPAARLAALETALALWEGPPFEEFEHVGFAARRLEEARLELEEDKASILAAMGRIGEAIATLEQVTRAEPLRESAWVGLARVLSESGRQAEAVRALDRYRDHLADIGLEPGPEFAAAQDEVFSPTAKTDRIPLPRVETSFLGRQEELRQLAALLTDHRLVTITGPGGMGKSRLGIEALRDWEDPPVTVVRLAGVGSDEEVAPAVLNAVGGEARGDPAEAIIARLLRSRSLLYLDNAEHVIEATASLASLILARTDSRLAVTSREPLNVLGEAVLTLGSLRGADAVALFRDRALRVDSEFKASKASLAELCEALDYMPLAIEMAAARSRALSPDEILERIGRRFELLDRPLRGGTGRHRTLDALVDWSYELLDEAERRVFERLSVVAGTFDLELATFLGGFGVVRPDEIPRVLASLVEKSLVDRTPGGDYRLMRVLRSYAETKLEMVGDAGEAGTLHSRWFGNLARQIGEGLSTSAETMWIDTAIDSVEDVGAALRWAVETGDLDTAQLILESLFDWLYHRHPPAIIGWGDLVLPHAANHDVRSSASAWTAVAAIKGGDLERAREIALEGTSVESPASRFAWFMAGDVACYQDRLADAQDAFRKQLVRASSVRDGIGVIDSIAGETIALAFQGRFRQASELAAELSGIAANVGAPSYRAYAQYAMAEAIILEDPERSATLFEDAAIRAASVNNQFIEAMARTSRASVLAGLSRFDAAIDDLHRASELWDGLVVPNYRWVVVQYAGAILAELGDTGDAIRLLAAADSAGRKPFNAGQIHWARVVAALRDTPGYDEWWAEGSTLSVDQAAELAMSATRRRR